MRCLKLALGSLGVAGLVAGANLALAEDHEAGAHVEHVLLVSIDGLHSLDVARYIRKHPNSALAELASHGITYSNASTPAHSDSFPGLLALITGGSPVSHDVFYDVSYDRALFDPSNTACSGLPGNTVVFDESIDQYTTDNVSLNVIDPAKLPRGRDAGGKCVAVYPHSFLKTNTVFEVVRDSGRRTAWADKHPAYDLVNGPSGHGVTDLYTPEITNVGGFDATASVVCTVENDNLKVAAIINEIHGKTHDGKPAGSVPGVFGMNFQAVSVGQKLAHDAAAANCNKAAGDRLRGKSGGYLDAAGTPSEVLEYGLDKTDAALARMIDALQDVGLYESTLVIVSAKHGQSPIDPAKSNKPGHFADLVAKLPAPSNANDIAAAAAISSANGCSTGPCGFLQDDDIALIWLQDQSQTQNVADYLNKNQQALFIDYVLAGDSMKLKFNSPQKDTRTPDLFVQPLYGTVYTGSSRKNAEHGGFSFGDTGVGLILSNPELPAIKIKTPVATSQVAPTILVALGLDPDALDAVRVEHTQILPGWRQEHHR